MSRHRGAKPCRRCGLLGKISLLSPEYLLSVERRPSHVGPPDHQGTRRRSLGAPRVKEIYCHTRGAAGASFPPSTVPTHPGGAPPGHAHGEQSHREPGVGAQWESARMGTGARAPRAIGTEHAGHEGRDRAPGGPRHRDRGRDDGPCAGGRRKAPRGAPPSPLRA